MLGNYAGRVIDAHEIVRTVGFVIRAASDHGEVRDLNIRIEVAKLTSGTYKPLIWTLSPQTNCWVRHDAKLDSGQLERNSADEALSAAIDYVDSKTIRATSQHQAQTAPKVDRPEPSAAIDQNTHRVMRELRFVIFCPVHGVPQSGPMDLSIDALTKVSRLAPMACPLCNSEHYPSLLFGRRPARRLKIALALNGKPAGDSADRAEGDGAGNFNLFSSTNQLLLTVPAELCSFTVEELWKE